MVHPFFLAFSCPLWGTATAKAKDDNFFTYKTFNPAPNSVVTIPVTKEILAQITGKGFKLGGAVQQKSGSWPAVLGKKITVSKISVLPASDFMTLDLSSAGKSTTAAWSGVTIPSANFKLAKAGDVVVVTTTAEDAIRNEGNFQYNMGKLQLSGWNIPMFFVQTLSAADIEKSIQPKALSGIIRVQSSLFLLRLCCIVRKLIYLQTKLL